MHGPVVVEVSRGCKKHIDRFGIHFVFAHKFFPNRNVKRGSIDFAAHHRGNGGIVRTAVGNATEIGFRVDVGLQQKAARHEVAGRAALGSKRYLLAFHVGQAFDA